MREIKFRAWIEDKREKRMFYDNEFDGVDIAIKLNGVILFAEDCGQNCTSDEWEYKVELMQYTGLKDKNGKEIYEGDIVKYVWTASNQKPIRGSKLIRREEINPVKWGGYSDDEYVFNVECWLWKDIPLSDLIYQTKRTKNRYRESIEVIGNIYENPERIANN